MRFDFIGRKKIWFALSGVIILIGFLAIIFRGLNFGIEFKGGTLFDIKFAKPVEVYQVRKELKAFNLGGSTIQPTGKNEVLIRCRSLSSRQQQKVIKALDEKFGIKDHSIQNVGPGWGGHITRAALIALVLCLCGLLLYISMRFEFKMAVTATTALFHDILIAMGIYALVGRVITPNTIAALLTILGYSLYDTIVVYHKIMENTPRMSKQTYGGMVNDSINQVLARSINTSLTTLFPIICLLLIGGETLKDFAFVLFIGLTSATYSSIFTASPLLTLWKETEPRYRSLKAKYER